MTRQAIVDGMLPEEVGTSRDQAGGGWAAAEPAIAVVESILEHVGVHAWAYREGVL